MTGAPVTHRSGPRKAVLLLVGLSGLAPNALLSAQTRLTTQPPPRGSLTVLTPGPGPQNLYLAGTPAVTQISWAVSVQMRGTVFSVQRWMESNPACCSAQVNGLNAARWTDEGVQWPGTYIYRVTVFYPDGRVGSVDTRWARPDPVNPANFRATQSPGTVTLQWDAVPDASWYELFGPGLPYASFQVTASSFVVRNLPPGTYSWRIGTYYSSPNAPAPVSSAAATFPQVTVVVRE